MDTLPQEILQLIFTYCLPQLAGFGHTLTTLSLVCRKWRMITADPHFVRLHRHHQDSHCRERILQHIYHLLHEIDTPSSSSSASSASNSAVISPPVGLTSPLSPSSSFLALDSLNLENLAATALPDLSFLPNLRVLSLGENKLANLPPLAPLSQLRELTLELNLLTALPPDLEALENLEELRLEGNQLSLAPQLRFTALTRLRVLDLSDNRLTTFPDLSLLVELRHLSFGCNLLTSFPDLQALLKLEYLDLDKNEITKVNREHLQHLAVLEELHMNYNKLRSFPNVRLRHLTHLALKGNKLKTCPDLGGFQSLRCLDLSCNYLTTLVNVEALVQLEYLLISNNFLAEMPHVAGLANLQFVNIRNNKLRFAGESRELQHHPTSTIKF